MTKIYFDFNATLVVMNNLSNQEMLEKFGEKLKALSTKKGLTL